MSSSAPDLAVAVGNSARSFDGIRVAYVFGSRVRGRSHPESDLDVGVVYSRELDERRRELTRREIIASLTEHLGALGERADVVDLERADSAVSFRAVREGVLAFARTEADRVSTEVRIARRYDDDAPKRRLFRQAAIRAARQLGNDVHGRR